jgi:hypothetical protein
MIELLARRSGLHFGNLSFPIIKRKFVALQWRKPESAGRLGEGSQGQGSTLA